MTTGDSGVFARLVAANSGLGGSDWRNVVCSTFGENLTLFCPLICFEDPTDPLECETSSTEPLRCAWPFMLPLLLLLPDESGWIVSETSCRKILLSSLSDKCITVSGGRGSCKCVLVV